MNMFSRKIKDDTAKYDFHFRTMLSFGLKMQKLMGLETLELTEAKSNETKWDVDGFCLSVRCFPQNGWNPLIVALPIGVESERIGYSDYGVCPPASWYYAPKGTRTVFCPPEFLQDEILHRIEQKLDNFKAKQAGK